MFDDTNSQAWPVSHQKKDQGQGLYQYFFAPAKACWPGLHTREKKKVNKWWQDRNKHLQMFCPLLLPAEKAPWQLTDQFYFFFQQEIFPAYKNHMPANSQLVHNPVAAIPFLSTLY